jgi:uncharacterized protein (DUF58 family)
MRLESAARKLRYSYHWPDSAAAVASGDGVPSFVAAVPTDDVAPVSESGLNMSTTYPVWVVVDQRMTMFYGSRRRTKSVVAARAAALIAWCMLAQARPIGALVFNDREVSCFHAHASRLHMMLILHAILNQNHSLAPNTGFDPNPQMLNEALRRMETLETSGAAIFIITDASGYDDKTAALINKLSERDRLFFVLVYDPRQAMRPAIGSFLGEDCIRRLKSTDCRFVPVDVPLFRFSTRDDAVVQVSRAFKALSILSETRNRALVSALLRSHPAPGLEIVLQRSGLGAGGGGAFMNPSECS